MNSRLRVLGFAVAALARHRARNLVVCLVYALIVGLVASVLLFVETMKRQARLLLEDAPEIVVQRITGGRHELIPTAWSEELRGIRGVVDAVPRVWGYSYDPPTRATLTLWGADSVPPRFLELEDGGYAGLDDQPGCVVGQGVADLRFLGVGDRLPMKSGDGSLLAPRVVGIFTSASAILTNDLVVMPAGLVRRILGIDPSLSTDIAVAVANPQEIATVARKIQEQRPGLRVVSREQMLQTYSAVFDWRGGIWLAMLTTSALAFAILVWDKASGLSVEEHRTIGILKAVGWSTGEVMQLRLWEGSIVSVGSVLTGLVAAELHLTLFKGSLFAAVMKGWSVLYPPFELAPSLDGYLLLLCIPVAVLPYIAASLLPAWRAAITDADLMIRG